MSYIVRQDSKRTGYCYYGGYVIGGGYSRRPSKYSWVSSIKEAETLSKAQADKIVNSLRYNNPIAIKFTENKEPKEQS